MVLLREAPNGEKLAFVHKGKFDEESVFSFVSSGESSILPSTFTPPDGH